MPDIQFIDEVFGIEYQVGDTVTIVPSPDYECPLAWLESMTEHCGETAKIIGRETLNLGPYGDSRDVTGYVLDIDHHHDIWDASCFVESYERLGTVSVPEAASAQELSEFLGV